MIRASTDGLTCRVRKREQRQRQKAADPQRWRAMDSRRHRRARSVGRLMVVEAVKELVDDGEVRVRS